MVLATGRHWPSPPLCSLPSGANPDTAQHLHPSSPSPLDHLHILPPFLGTRRDATHKTRPHAGGADPTAPKRLQPRRLSPVHSLHL